MHYILLHLIIKSIQMISHQSRYVLEKKHIEHCSIKIWTFIVIVLLFFITDYYYTITTKTTTMSNAHAFTHTYAHTYTKIHISLSTIKIYNTIKTIKRSS